MSTYRNIEYDVSSTIRHINTTLLISSKVMIFITLGCVEQGNINMDPQIPNHLEFADLCMSSFTMLSVSFFFVPRLKMQHRLVTLLVPERELRFHLFSTSFPLLFMS